MDKPEDAHLVLVEDEDSIMTVNLWWIKDMGWTHIHGVRSVLELTAYLSESLRKGDPVDLILMDIVMPEINGIEGTQIVRRQQAFGDIPIIMLTSMQDKDILESAFSTGANDYVLNVLKKRKIAVIGDTSGYGTSSAKTATELLKKAGVEPVYSTLIDPNKTDLTDEMTKARAAGAEVVMPWSAATGLLGRLLNARGEMGWKVPVVGHPALMASQIRKLLNKPEYWEDTYASGYQSTTYGPDGKLPARTQALVDKIRPKFGKGELDILFWWVAMGYDTVKLIEYSVKQAGGTDPAKIQKALENTHDYPGVYATYTWSPKVHNGFPDSNMAVNAANTFKDGSFKLAPR